jgi:cysteinyl-tRNA synthetase
MKLYNTLTKKLEELTPQQDNLVRIYSCGPTVYDHAHIGNLSSYIYADTLRRTIQSAGYETSHTMNITDVDDKTISRSLESNHNEDPQTALRQFTETYTRLFFDDMDAVGNHLSAFSFVKATDYIDNMKLMFLREIWIVFIAQELFSLKKIFI